MGEIREDQKVKLFIKLADDSEKELDCRIKEVQKDRLVLDFPKEALEYSNYLEEGCEVPVRLFTTSGVRVFDSIVLNSPLEPEFVIEFAEEQEEIQRREYLRVNATAKIILTKGKDVCNVTNTLDISGGGAKFISLETFEPDEEVNFMLYLPNEVRSIMGKGKILSNSNGSKNEYVIVFTEIKETDRDRIIKACFEFQTMGNEQNEVLEVE